MNYFSLNAILENGLEERLNVLALRNLQRFVSYFLRQSGPFMGMTDKHLQSPAVCISFAVESLV